MAVFNVNLFTGELCHRVVGPSLAGPLPVDFSRSYASSSRYESPMGVGWTAPYDIRLERKGSSLLLYQNGDELESFDDPGASGEPVDGAAYSLRYLRERTWLAADKEEKLYYEFDDADGVMLLAAIEDRYGNRLTFKRDKAGRIRTLTDSVGRRMEFSYDGSLIHQVVLARHGSDEIGEVLLECAYDGNRNLVETADVFGGRQTYQYAGHRLVACRNPRGGVHGAIYDAEGRCIQVWEEQGRRFRRFEFDRLRRVTKVTDGLGYTAIYRFDESGQLLEGVDPLGGVVQKVRNEQGELVATLLPTGEAAGVFQYDPEQRQLSETDPSGATTVH